MKKKPIETLSPHEYLEWLQHERFGSHLPPFAADVGDVLTATLLASLPSDQQKQLDRIAIGVLPSKSVNAGVGSVPGGGEVITFDFGLMSFMLALNKILLSRANILGFEPLMDFETAADRAAVSVKSFFGDDELPRSLAAPRRMLVASSLSNIQTSFVVGHELGHVVLGHLKNIKFEPDHQRDAKLDTDKLHEMEFAADARGAEIVLASFKNSYNPVFGSADAALAQAGPDIFFTYLVYMGLVLKQPMDGPTHPSSVDRRTKLRERYWSDLPENAQTLATFAEKTFDGFGQMLD